MIILQIKKINKIRGFYISWTNLLLIGSLARFTHSTYHQYTQRTTKHKCYQSTIHKTPCRYCKIYFRIKNDIILNKTTIFLLQFDNCNYEFSSAWHFHILGFDEEKMIMNCCYWRLCCVQRDMGRLI